VDVRGGSVVGGLEVGAPNMVIIVGCLSSFDAWILTMVTCIN
jgi:hypothetical protein